MIEGRSQTQGGMAGSFFSDMMTLRESRSARASSWDRTGANRDFETIPAGETLELANIPGLGCIRHMYFTITISGQSFGDPRYLRDLVLRGYWDGEETPSIEVPFGDFFGQGHGCIRFFRSLMIVVNEGAELAGGTASTLTVGFNSYFPMPFADGARLTLTNDGDYEVASVWYHIDYEELDGVDPGVGRFHAQWRRKNPTTAVGDVINTPHNDNQNLDGRDNYVILEAQGHGNFVGYFLNIHSFFETWYGEGDDPHDRAYMGFTKLQANNARYRALLAEKKLHPPADLEKGVLEKLAAEIAAAFRSRDYVLAADKCQLANERIEAFLAARE